MRDKVGYFPHKSSICSKLISNSVREIIKFLMDCLLAYGNFLTFRYMDITSIYIYIYLKVYLDHVIVTVDPKPFDLGSGVR